MTIRPVSFFVYLGAFKRGNVQWQDMDICLDNGQTNERLVVKAIEPHPDPVTPFVYQHNRHKFVLISRYPVGANKEWIEANEQEIMQWKFREQDRRIHFEQPTKWWQCVKKD